MLPKVFESFVQTDDRCQNIEIRCQKSDVRGQITKGEKISAFRNPTSYYL